MNIIRKCFYMILSGILAIIGEVAFFIYALSLIVKEYVVKLLIVFILIMILFESKESSYFFQSTENLIFGAVCIVLILGIVYLPGLFSLGISNLTDWLRVKISQRCKVQRRRK